MGGDEGNGIGMRFRYSHVALQNASPPVCSTDEDDDELVADAPLRGGTDHVSHMGISPCGHLGTSIVCALVFFSRYTLYINWSGRCRWREGCTLVGFISTLRVGGGGGDLYFTHPHHIPRLVVRILLHVSCVMLTYNMWWYDVKLDHGQVKLDPELRDSVFHFCGFHWADNTFHQFHYVPHKNLSWIGWTPGSVPPQNAAGTSVHPGVPPWTESALEEP